MRYKAYMEAMGHEQHGVIISMKFNVNTPKILQT